MKHINDEYRTQGTSASRPVSAAIACLALLLVAAAPGFAHIPAGDESMAEAQVQLSAYEAKRLARAYLCRAGYCSRIGPGAAKLRSITRDGGTWVLSVRLSDVGSTFNRQHVLFVDADTGTVSEERPVGAPAKAAAQ